MGFRRSFAPRLVITLASQTFCSGSEVKLQSQKVTTFFFFFFGKKYETLRSQTEAFVSGLTLTRFFQYTRHCLQCRAFMDYYSHYCYCCFSDLFLSPEQNCEEVMLLLYKLLELVWLCDGCLLSYSLTCQVSLRVYSCFVRGFMNTVCWTCSDVLLVLNWDSLK